MAAGTHQSRARDVFVEEADFAEEFAGVQIGQHDLVPLLVFQGNGHRAGDDVKQILRRFALSDDGRLRRTMPAMAMFKETFNDVTAYSRRKAHFRHV